jgi:hypothetical protein
MTQTPEQDRDYASEFRQLVEQADAAQSQSYDPMAPADTVPLVEPGLSGTAKALEGDGLFEGLAKQNAAEREADAEKGIFGSFLDAAVGKAKSIFTLDDDSRRYLSDRLLVTPTAGLTDAVRTARRDAPLSETEKGLARGAINRRGSSMGGMAQIAGDLGAPGVSVSLDESAKSLFDVSQSDLFKAKVETLGKIKSEAWFSDTMDYVSSKFGEGVGSSVESFATALSPLGLPGTLGLGYTGSIGEIRQELQEAGVTDPGQIAKYSYLAAIPHAALDQFTEVGVLAGLSQQARKEITKKIVRTVLASGAKEGATEAAQRVIEIGAVAHALGGDSPSMAVLAALSADLEKGIDSTILESGVSGFIPGLGFGAVEVAGDRAMPGEPTEVPKEPVREAKAKTGTATDASPAPAEEATPTIPAGKKSRTIDLDGFTPAQLQNEDRTVPGPEINVGPDGQVAPRIVPRGPSAAREVTEQDVQTYIDAEGFRTNRPAESVDAPETRKKLEKFNQYVETREGSWYMDNGDLVFEDRNGTPIRLANDESVTDDFATMLGDGGAKALDQFLLDRGADIRTSSIANKRTAKQPDFIDQIAEAVASPEAAPVIEQVAEVAEQVAPGITEQLQSLTREDLTAVANEIGISGLSPRASAADIVDRIGRSLAQAEYEASSAELARSATPVGGGAAVNPQAGATALEAQARRIADAISRVATAQPAADATDTSDSAYKRLVSVLAGKTTRTGWAKATKVSEKTLGTLLARAEKDGLVRKDSAGNYRRGKDIKAAVKALRKGAPAATPRAAAAPSPATAPETAEIASPLPPATLSIPADMRIEKAIGARERKLRRPLPPYITNYAREIERARGTPEMDAVIARMQSDEMIRKAEMHEIAALVGKKVTKSATKKAALQTILDRHNDAIAARVGAVLEQEPEANAVSDTILEDAGRVLEEGISQLLQEIGAIQPVGEPSGNDRAGSGELGGGLDGGPVDEIAGGDGRADAVRGIDPADGARDGASGPVAGPAEVLTDEQRAAVAAKVAADKEAADQKRRDRETLNYQITDDDKIGQGGPKAKIRANLAAIKTLRTLEDDGRGPTEAEKKVLVKYTGWGAFSQDMFEEYKPEFQKERDEFRSLVSKEEYEAARNSTRNAHYTSPDVVNAMWAAMQHLGYKGGRAIEPGAGSGNFIGLTPANLREATEWTAVELDPLTGGIAKNLYQATDVRIQGYQDAKFPDGFFDLAISNVPFSDSKPYDPVYKGKYVLHDFYFLKSLDKVRPGGLVAFITSAGTMDKRNAAARREIAKRADLVGAIRLPGGSKGAFKSNAGTDVTTDILFLRKRIEGEKDLSSIMVDIDYTNADGEQETARVAANKALGMVDKRVNGLRELLGCLA